MSRLVDLETGPIEHRLEEPTEGTVLIAQMRLQLWARPTILGSLGCARQPFFDNSARFSRMKEKLMSRRRSTPFGLRIAAIRSRASAFQKSGRW